MEQPTNYEQIDQALYEFSEFAENELALIGLTFIAVGKTLEQLLNNRVTDKALYFVCEERYTLGQRATDLRNLLTHSDIIQNETIGGSQLSFEINGITFRIRIIKEKYSFLDYPDVKSYEPGTGGLFIYYNAPNPLEEYRKSNLVEIGNLNLRQNKQNVKKAVYI